MTYVSDRLCSIMGIRKRVLSWCPNVCGKPVARSGQFYCSLSCLGQHRFRLKYIAFVDAGGTYGHISSQFIKKVLRKRLGDRCSRCGWAAIYPVTGKVPVEIEHIDGNWENNRLSNLTLLCPNCHSLTSTFRGLNRGAGRPHRIGSRGNPFDPGKALERYRSPGAS